MSSEMNDHKQAMLGELLGELDRTRRGRVVRKRIGEGAAAVLVVGAGVITALSLSGRPAAAPSAPIAHRGVTIERVVTDPTILDRVRIASDSSRIERIQTRAMPELRVNDAELVAFMAVTDAPVGVVRIAGEARIVSARWKETRTPDQNESPM